MVPYSFFSLSFSLVRARTKDASLFLRALLPVAAYGVMYSSDELLVVVVILFF